MRWFLWMMLWTTCAFAYNRSTDYPTGVCFNEQAQQVDCYTYQGHCWQFADDGRRIACPKKH